MNLSNIFSRYAGKEIKMVEGTFKYRGKDYPEVRLKNPKDPLLKEIQKTAQKNGLSLRVFWPGVAGTMDYRTDRVNADINKSPDGKWRISGFRIG